MPAAAKSRADSAPSLAPVFTYPKDEPVCFITRKFAAPRDLVWRALTDPKLVAQWWGPRRYTTEVKEMDFRVGGQWRFVNKGAGGADHEFFGEYREIVAPEKIVQTFGFMDFPPAIETMTLEDQGGYTQMSITSRFPNIEMRDGMVGSGMQEGATETYERLDAVLAGLQGPSAQLVGRELNLTRLIDAPRALVWKAWTDPKMMVAWWGPHAFSAPECEMDVRVGGKLLIVMSNPLFGDLPMTGEFTEVDPPSRLAFIGRAHTDASGVAKIENLNTITLAEENGKTRLHLHAKMLAVAPDMAGAVAGWSTGWSQSLEKLESQVSIMKMFGAK